MKQTARDRIAYSQLGGHSQSVDSVITRLMAAKLEHPEILSLAAGFTDNRILPEGLVRETVRLLGGTENRAHLQYGTNAGRPGLREAVIDLLRVYPGEEGLELNPDQVLITNGSQQALYILVQALCDPGDIVLVERPSYFVFLELLRGMGVRAVSIPDDSAGRIDPAGLDERLRKLEADGDADRVKLIYLMGAFANPSTRCISESEKTGLIDVLGSRSRPIPVVEDMAYRELYFDAPYPARSLLALEDWEDYPVLYLGTFTKPLATGLKTGFVVSRDAGLLGTLARIKGHQDFGSAHFNQAIIERILREGLYSEHLEGIRRHYAAKRDRLESILVENGLREAGWTWETPGGGLLLWVRGPEGMDTRIDGSFHRACIDKEVLYVPGDLCYAEGRPWSDVRLSFGAIEAEKIPEAGRRFCEAARSAR